ncbi:MAG TPA: FtsX-like permease family protein [Vicinamibacterales bacterium]|nr:FtsX-like permease family protein [Vicinamibacterales bacterium]
MSFIARMAWREVRASWRRLLFFFICIAVGVASIVTIRSVIQSVRQALTTESRTLTGGDIVISGNAPLAPHVTDVVEREHHAGRIQTVSHSLEAATMVRPGVPGRETIKMVELKAVEPGFPLYGTLTLADNRTYSHRLLEGHGALVRPELLALLDVHVGDTILIGRQPFEIRGVIKDEPGRNLSAFSLGPRVLIDYADMASTGLLTFGSRISQQVLLRIANPQALGTVDTALRTELASELVSIRGFWRNADRIGQNLTRAENYLSLVGLVVLILGGIGVSSVTRVFVQQKVRSIAILKCVGTSTRQVLAIYLTQVLLLGIAGSVLGVAIAAGVIAALPRILGELPALFQVDYGLSVSAVAQGLLIGLLVSLLFSVVPLLEVRNVKPSLLLRQDMPRLPSFDWLKWIVTAFVAAALVGVASWQAGSLRVGLILSAGFVAVSFVLYLAGLILIRAVQPLRYSRSFALRQAVLHVARPGNQTRVILLAVGLGAFFILGVRSLQANLLQDFALQVGDDAPDMFLIDVQPDQREPLTSFIDAQNGAAPPPYLIPVLRARVVGVQGRELNLESYEQVRGRGGLSREFTVTYRDGLEANEKVIAGKWWDPKQPPQEPEVSIEEGFLDRQRIQIGDHMTFDVLGRTITARVASIRRVQWEDYRAGGFMFVFSPRTFEGAPHTYISAVQGPTDATARTRMQAQIVAQFPNVSVIDLREILTTVRGIVDNVTFGVTVVGALVLFSGALILVGAVSMTKFRRVYEAAILKTLGASSRLIATMLLLEYGVLGAIAGTVGALGAIALSWSIARFVLELPWTPAPALTAIGIGGTAIFVAAVGVLASVDVLRHKPLATLRAE